MSTNEIENVLRRAPQPKPPGNLKHLLKAQALNAPKPAAPRSPGTQPEGSWLSRWWPAMIPTAVSLACAAGLTVQRLEIQSLKANLESSSISDANGAALPGKSATAVESLAASSDSSSSEQDELARLKALAAQLNAEISKLEQGRAENDKLRAQIAALSKGAFTQEETEAMDAARDRAQSIQCVNNLKQLGLAVRVWALDNNNMSPPNLLCMSNEIGSFKIMVCPADTGRQPAKDPSSFSPANCSYEYLAPSAPDTEPARLLFRCPIHGHIGLVDGSVQSKVAKDHPERLYQKDGKYFYWVDTQPAEPLNAQPAQPGQSQ